MNMDFFRPIKTFVYIFSNAEDDYLSDINLNLYGISLVLKQSRIYNFQV